MTCNDHVVGFGSWIRSVLRADAAVRLPLIFDQRMAEPSVYNADAGYTL